MCLMLLSLLSLSFSVKLSQRNNLCICLEANNAKPLNFINPIHSQLGYQVCIIAFVLLIISLGKAFAFIDLSLPICLSPSAFVSLYVLNWFGLIPGGLTEGDMYLFRSR